MNLYVVMGKYSQDYISGLIYKPQDRKKASLTILKLKKSLRKHVLQTQKSKQLWKAQAILRKIYQRICKGMLSTLHDLNKP